MQRFMAAQDKLRGMPAHQSLLPTGGLLGIAKYDLKKKEYQQQSGNRVYSVPIDMPKPTVITLPIIPTMANPEGKDPKPQRTKPRDRLYLPGERLLKKLHKDHKREKRQAVGMIMPDRPYQSGLFGGAICWKERDH